MMPMPRPRIADLFGNPHIRAAIRREAWFRLKFTLGLLMAIALTVTALLIGRASAAEVPAWVLRGIASVETNTTWRDMGDLTYRDRRIGDAGEVGPWQLSPAVLRDLKVYDQRSRIHADPVFAESLTRAWLLRLYRVTGSWWEVLAAYNGGLRGRFSAAATDYANRATFAGTGLRR